MEKVNQLGEAVLKKKYPEPDSLGPCLQISFQVTKNIEYKDLFWNEKNKDKLLEAGDNRRY